MEGLNISPQSPRIEIKEKPALPRQKKEMNPEEEEARREAASFVLDLRSILGPYKLNINSTKEDIARLDEGVMNKLASKIKDLATERGINYLSEKNELILSEIKNRAGETIGTFVEKIAFGNINNETMEEIIEKMATSISVKIDDEASLVVREKTTLDEQTKALEEFVEQNIKMMTSDTKWNPTNLKKLLNKILDSVKATWNGSPIKSLIFKIGKKILKEREEEFMEHGI